MSNRAQDSQNVIKIRARTRVFVHLRATLDLALRHVNMEKKSSHDQMTRQQRENDRDIRMLKKTLAQEKSAQESYAHLENIYDRVVEQVCVKRDFFQS